MTPLVQGHINSHLPDTIASSHIAHLPTGSLLVCSQHCCLDHLLIMKWWCHLNAQTQPVSFCFSYNKHTASYCTLQSLLISPASVHTNTHLSTLQPHWPATSPSNMAFLLTVPHPPLHFPPVPCAHLSGKPFLYVKCPSYILSRHPRALLCSICHWWNCPCCVWLRNEYLPPL